MSKAILREESKIISDPLAWQTAMDASSAGINLRGSERFWRTVEALGIERVYSDGVPEFTEIVFRLKGNIGLRLFAKPVYRNYFELGDHAVTPHIGFEFCEIVEGEADATLPDTEPTETPNSE